ncbi:MAG: alpha/beta hydrolase [Paraburkholderia sp.]|nr:MAG: alpha/beta hydrolase [Paraburkholderia sp.]
MPSATRPTTVILAPGGPGLGPETLESLPLPHGCKRLSAMSACHPGDDPIALQTTRLIELISAAAPSENVVLIGHSAGAWAAIRAASQTSADLTAVVLIAAQLRNRIDQPELLRKRLRMLGQPTRQYAQRAQSLSPARLPPEESELLDLLVADLSLTLPVTGAAQFAFLDACRRSWNVQAMRSLLTRPVDDELPTLVQQMQTPMMVINGEHDPWAGAASATEIGAAAKNCVVEIIPGAGHAPWLDEPKRVGELLVTTLEKASSK